MGVRRQIYLQESDDRLLEERSKAIGISVSELVRRAINECYGGPQRLTVKEFFQWPGVKPGTGDGTWAYDPVLDADFDDQLDAEMDAIEAKRRA